MLYLGTNDLLQGRDGLWKTETTKTGPNDASGVVGTQFRQVSTTSLLPANPTCYPPVEYGFKWGA